MKRTAFISDIHGNYPALKAVLEQIDRSGVDQIYCLGDLVGFYSMINEVLDLLRTRNIPCLKGNHDHALLYDAGVIARSKTCTKVLQRQINEIRKDHSEWLGTLSSRLDVEFEFGQVTMVHGGIDCPVDEYMYEIPEDYFAKRNFSGKWFFHGHTHFPRHIKVREVNCVNPGSVGQPRDLNPRASYCTLEGQEVQFYRVEYDVLLLENDMRAKGYDEYIIDSIRKGSRIGG